MKVYFHMSIEGFSNCYVILNEETKEALIIDPGKITTKIIEQIESDDYKLVAVLITHNHPSHVRGLKTLQRIYSPQIFASDYEVAEIGTKILRGDGVIKIAGLSVSYLSIPGHTSDSLVFKIGQVMFTGDSLSACKIGKTNSKYSEQTLLSNIRTKITCNQTDVLVMPGHGPPSTLITEKKYNLSFGDVHNENSVM